MVVDELDEHVGEVNPRTDAEGKLIARSTEAIVEPSILGALDGRCKKHGCLLTVHFDDVTLSGETVPGEFIWNVRQLIHRAGLPYHKDKHYVGRPVEITGVILSG